MMSHDDQRKNPIRQVPMTLPNARNNSDDRYPISPLALGATAMGANSSEVPLREYMRVLFKYRIIVAGITLLGAVLSTLYAFTATPRYTATAKIRISTYQPILAATRIEDMLQEKSKEASYLETQVEELKSFSLADRVLRDAEVLKYFQTQVDEDDSVATSSGREGYKASLPMMRSYLDAIDINPVRRTSLVLIDATAKDPIVAALIARRHADAYIEWVRSTRVEQQARALQFLRQQADELRERVGDIEREMADYAEANAIVAVNKDENIIAQKMAQLNQLLTEVNGKKLEAENLYRQAEASAQDGSAGFDDPSLQTMRAELAKVEAEYQQLSAKFMPGYPRMKELSSQIGGLKRSIIEQRRQVVVGLKAKADALADQEKGLQEELEQQKSRAFELSKKQVQYNSLNRDLTSSRELLENVLKQIKETGLSVESNSSNISIVDAPVTPQFPSFPRKKLMVLLGLIVGVAAGLAAAFLLDYIDNSIKTPEDVNHYLQLPNLGVVPSFELERLTFEGKLDTGTPPGRPPLGGESPDELVKSGQLPAVKDLAVASSAPVVFMSAPKSLAAEAYRTIRTGILLSQAGEPPRTLLVTSAQSGEGKTTSSVNLAASLASSGGRVVIIDADLRRPSLSKHFKLDRNLPGLVEVISGQRLLEDVMITNVIKRVTVIPSGRIPPNPAELLGSYEMLGLLDRLANEFDYVVVDSPPILPVTDSVVLSRFVDGVVLVVRGGNTPRRIISDAKERLVSVGARILGTILNDVDLTGGDYYHYSRYYTSYYQEEDRPRGAKGDRMI